MMTLLDLLAPPALGFQPRHTVFGDQTARVMVILDYPPRVGPAWLARLCNMPGVVASIHLVPADSLDMLKALNKSIQEYTSRLAAGGNALAVSRWQQSLDDARLLLKKVDQEAQKVYRVAVIMMVLAPDEEELARRSRQVEAACAAAGMRARTAVYRQEDALKATGPWGMLPPEVETMAGREMPAETIAAAYPWVAGGLNHGRGAVWARDADGGLVLVDRWHPPEGSGITNPNLNILGTSGGGKSFAGKVLLLREYALAAHIEYAGTRPRSTGLFGPDPQHPPLLAEAMKEVGNREASAAWRIVFSLREDDARELGVANLASWQDLTRRAMAKFARQIGMQPGHLCWVAAHHPEQGHPHVHVIAWLADGAPRRKGKLSATELRDVRRGVIQEVFGPLRTRLAVERTLARNTMLETVKENVEKAERMLQRIELEAQVAEPVGERLPPKFAKEDMEVLASKIEKLAGTMPGKGQAKLAYMPAEAKEKARAIADWILSRPQMAGPLTVHEKATRELTGLYTKKSGQGDEAWQKAYEDLRDRVANVVIRSAAAHQQLVRRHPKRELKLDLACSTMKSAWRALERERLRAEAKAQWASLQAAEQAEERGRMERDMGNRDSF